MACDIHICIEENNGGYGQPDNWELIATERATYQVRCYQLFERLAGVRGNDELAIALPRGIPEGISRATQARMDAHYAEPHSITWFLLPELMSVDWSECAPSFGEWLEALAKFCFIGGGNDYDNALYRLVTWFDN